MSQGGLESAASRGPGRGGRRASPCTAGATPALPPAPSAANSAPSVRHRGLGAKHRRRADDRARGAVDDAERRRLRVVVSRGGHLVDRLVRSEDGLAQGIACSDRDPFDVDLHDAERTDRRGCEHEACPCIVRSTGFAKAADAYERGRPGLSARDRRLDRRGRRVGAGTRRGRPGGRDRQADPPARRERRRGHRRRAARRDALRRSPTWFPACDASPAPPRRRPFRASPPTSSPSPRRSTGSPARAALAEIARVLRSDGLLVLVVEPPRPQPADPGRDQPDHRALPVGHALARLGTGGG